MAVDGSEEGAVAVSREIGGVRRPARRDVRVVREGPKITDWLQALSGIVTILFAAGALGVAAYTYWDQQQLNRDQLTLNEAARQRTQQRFASRVAWWTDTTSASAGLRTSGEIFIQNRSPVPIRDVELSAGEGGPWILASDLPPCTIRGYSIEYFHGRDLVILSSSAGFFLVRANLSFVDPEGSWILTREGLTRSKGTRVNWPPIGRLEQIAELEEAAADCGEGG